MAYISEANRNWLANINLLTVDLILLLANANYFLSKGVQQIFIKVFGSRASWSEVDAWPI